MPGPAAMQGVLHHIRRTEFRCVYDLLGDGELLARFLAERDEIAFEELVGRHGPMVRAICRRILGPTPDADDAFQATFLVLIRKARSIRRTELLANWLCAVSYRTARQAMRRRWRLGTREQNVATLPEPIHFDEPPRDWLPHFDAALQRLPCRYREAIVLCDLQGMTRPDAARKLGLNEGTLSSRLGRGRELLRKKLSRHGFPLAVAAALAPSVVPEALTASTVAAAAHFGVASVSVVVLTEGVLTAMFISKLKAATACAAVLVVGVVASLQFAGTTTLADGPPGKSSPTAKNAETKPAATERAPDPRPPLRLAAEYEPFQGEWVVTAADNGNGTGTGAVGVDENWKFVGNVLTTGGEAKEDSAEKFTLDPKAKPASIDFTLTRFTTDATGELVPAHFQGIYKFESDGRLVICYRQKSERILRPTRFATAHNSGATLLSLRRPSQPPQPIAITHYMPVTQYVDPRNPQLAPPIATAHDPLTQQTQSASTDLDLLQGTWVIRQQDGKPPATGSQRDDTIEFLKDRILTSDGGHSRIRLDESRSPRQIVMTMPKQGDETMTGIYKIEDDRLTIAMYSKSGKLIPTGFEPDPELGITVMVMVRHKVPAPPPISRVQVTPTNDPQPPRSDPIRPPVRDLVKEIDQLREQILRLEKELKNRR